MRALGMVAGCRTAHHHTPANRRAPGGVRCPPPCLRRSFTDRAAVCTVGAACRVENSVTIRVAEASVLAQVPLFAFLPADDLDTLVRCLRQRDYKKGET